ncbi:MAG: adenylate/guanylate cyclase domain-containing protein [Chitinophagaceae bacterium]
MTRRLHMKFAQLRVIVIAWLFLGFMIALHDHLVMQMHSSLGPAADYSLLHSIVVNMVAALVGALLGGSFLVFYINEKYQNKPYGYTVAAVTLSFIAIILLISVVLAAIAYPDRARLFKNGLVWAAIVAITQLLLQINSKFGPGIFWNLIRGKYNTPREEKRIFMFLDINSSTTIAEKLGDKKYHSFLRDFYADITNPILDNKGEIYQYVGDEVVIAWKYSEGVERNQCIRCFFEIKEQIQSLKDKYLARYGTWPSFKAGMHCGMVVVGEIGNIKRDITYSGDVLNTAARIQGLCKEYKKEVIASAELIDELTPLKKFEALPLGSIKLRGKEKEIPLIAISPL